MSALDWECSKSALATSRTLAWLKSRLWGCWFNRDSWRRHRRTRTQRFHQTGQAIYGHSRQQAGVVGESDTFDGIFGISHNPQAAGLSGHNPGGMAGYFEGDVLVTGDVCCAGADCAEQFAVADSLTIVPGLVMSICTNGSLEVCATPYDTRVAGLSSRHCLFAVCNGSTCAAASPSTSMKNSTQRNSRGCYSRWMGGRCLLKAFNKFC